MLPTQAFLAFSVSLNAKYRKTEMTRSHYWILLTGVILFGVVCAVACTRLLRAPKAGATTGWTSYPPLSAVWESSAGSENNSIMPVDILFTASAGFAAFVGCLFGHAFLRAQRLLFIGSAIFLLTNIGCSLLTYLRLEGSDTPLLFSSWCAQRTLAFAVLLGTYVAFYIALTVYTLVSQQKLV